MSTSSVIGASITVKGDITADEPLTVAGRVEGKVTVAAHALTVDANGHVNAEVKADSVVVSGHVNGSLTATAKVVVSGHSPLTGRRLARRAYDTDRSPSCHHDRCIRRSAGKKCGAGVIAR